jgi:hypothetical protein
MNKDDVTIVIVTSVIPSHPSTHIVDETIRSIRHYFPTNEIIIQIDGLRDERINRKDDYDEYKNRILWKALHEDTNILPIIFDRFSHQTTMMSKTINMIKTPLMLYVEGDAPLVTDEPIDWDKCINFIETGQGKTIRFHFEASIPEPHKHLMFKLNGDFLETAQWSQRPHLTTVDYYRDIVLPLMPDKEFIEDTLHGLIQDHILPYEKYSKMGWEEHKLHIYHPEGNIKRSLHLDGRAGTRKFTTDDEAWGYTE